MGMNWKAMELTDFDRRFLDENRIASPEDEARQLGVPIYEYKQPDVMTDYDAALFSIDHMSDAEKKRTFPRITHSKLWFWWHRQSLEDRADFIASVLWILFVTGCVAWFMIANWKH